MNSFINYKMENTREKMRGLKDQSRKFGIQHSRKRKQRKGRGGNYQRNYIRKNSATNGKGSPSARWGE